MEQCRAAFFLLSTTSRQQKNTHGMDRGEYSKCSQCLFSQCYGRKGSTQVGGEDVSSRSEKQEAGSKGGGPSLHTLNI